MTVHETLVRARNRIATRGWVQGGTGRRGAAVCAGNAIIDAGSVATMAEAADELASAAGIDSHCVPEWNDARRRTKEEVLAAFDEAIAATAPEPDTPFLTEPVRDEVPA